MKRIVSLLFVGLLTISVSAQWTNSQGSVPAYHPFPPAKGEKLPPILSGSQLSGPSFQHAVQIHAYELAAKIPGVLYQQPCYCRCDLSHGHKSLRSCFESTHGASCGTCMQEASYAYTMHKHGWSARMIRDGIIRGDYKSVDLQHPDWIK